jgi:hypothetical protein
MQRVAKKRLEICFSAQAQSVLPVNLQVASAMLMPDERLVVSGKPMKVVALVACMRRLLTILNAVMKYRTPWRQISPGRICALLRFPSWS